MQYAAYPSTNNTTSFGETQVIKPTSTTIIQTVETAGAIDLSAIEIRLRELHVQLARAKKKYSKYVSVAATTPAYFWVPIAGTISAPVVAGVYGDRANKKKKLIESKHNSTNCLPYTSYTDSISLGLQSEIAVLEFQLAQLKTAST